MYKTLFLSVFATTALFAKDAPVIGAVNFNTCTSESKSGKKEQESFEALRNHMASLVENTEKEIKELSAKFEDSEYLDSLSPKAEEELRLRFQTLQEDMGRYQSQFYQIMQQAHYQTMQKMQGAIAKAAEKVAKEQKLDYVLNREVCFYINPDLDVTSSVIVEMDRLFDADPTNAALEQASLDALSKGVSEAAAE